MLDLKFLFVSAAISSASLIWRKLLIDFPKLKIVVERVVGKVGTCGFCYTFWFSLVIILLADPNKDINFYVNDWMPEKSAVILGYLLKWLSTGYLALVFRTLFLYINNLKKVSGHAHEKHHVA